jgi:general secretion pathway protein A
MPPTLLEFYGLQEHPFGTTPNPRFLFPSETHRKAQASLALGIESQFGFTALIAPPGLGKTTLLFDLLTTYRNNAQAAFVFTTQCNSLELLRYIVTDLQVPGTENETDPVRLHQKFAQFVARNPSPHPVLVVIDEAQNLDASALESVRLLSDFETPDRKLLHIILAGQPQLSQRLREPGLSQLLQRITNVSRLTPLTSDETSRYIDHRLRSAGFKREQLFSELAILKIAAESGGVPRAINRICLNALQLGFAAGHRQIGCDLIDEAAAGFDLEDIPPISPPSPAEPATIRASSGQVNFAKASRPDGDLTAAAAAVKQLPKVSTAPRIMAAEALAKAPSASPVSSRAPQAPYHAPQVHPYQWKSSGNQILWIALSIILIALAIFGYVEWRTIVASLSKSTQQIDAAQVISSLERRDKAFVLSPQQNASLPPALIIPAAGVPSYANQTEMHVSSALCTEPIRPQQPLSASSAELIYLVHVRTSEQPTVGI